MKKWITFIFIAVCISSLLCSCSGSKIVYWEEKPEEEYASFMNEKTEELKNIVSLMSDVFASEKGKEQKQVQKNDTYKLAYDTAIAWLENINQYTAVPTYAKDLHTYLISYGQSALSFITSVPACCETSDTLKISDSIAVLNADYDHIQTELDYVSAMSAPSCDVSFDELNGNWRTGNGDIIVFNKDSLLFGKEEYSGTYESGRFTSENMTLIVTEKNNKTIKANVLMNKVISNITAKLIEDTEMAIGTVLRDASNYQLTFDGAHYASTLIPSKAQAASGYTYYENSKEDSQYFIAEFTLKNTGAEKLNFDISNDLIFNVSYMETLNYDSVFVIENAEGSGFIGKPDLLTASSCKVYARFTVPKTVETENCKLSVSFGNYNYIYEYIPELINEELNEGSSEVTPDTAS